MIFPVLSNCLKMTDRRSSRTRKTVDYSKFSGGDSDNDDDFRESGTQPAKRKKKESSSPKSVKVKLTKIDTDSYKIEAKKTEKRSKDNKDDEPKKRLPLSDKVFQRHLSEAIEISKQQDSEELSSTNENPNSLLLNGQDETENGETEVDHPVPNDVSSAANGKLVSEKRKPRGNKSKDDDDEWDDASSSVSEEEDDASEWSDEEKETKVKKPDVKRRNSKRNQDEEEESDDWSGDDRKKKSKKPVVKKSEPKKQPRKVLNPKTAKSPTPVTPKCIKSSKKISGSSTVSLGLKPTVKSPGTPCQVISSPVKLPPKGIRLGLSRKVSGKPLHSIVKVQQ